MAFACGLGRDLAAGGAAGGVSAVDAGFGGGTIGGMRRKFPGGIGREIGTVGLHCEGRRSKAVVSATADFGEGG